MEWMTRKKEGISVRKQQEVKNIAERASDLSTVDNRITANIENQKKEVGGKEKLISKSGAVEPIGHGSERKISELHIKLGEIKKKAEPNLLTTDSVVGQKKVEDKSKKTELLSKLEQLKKK